jgi:hypothetical protein
MDLVGLLILATAFALGYATRAFLSHKRRRRAEEIWGDYS